MQKVSVELTEQQAEQLLDQLSPEKKIQLVRRWERKVRRDRWEPLVLKMRERFAQRPLSARAIRRLCETVRQDRFARARRP